MITVDPFIFFGSVTYISHSNICNSHKSCIISINTTRKLPRQKFITTRTYLRTFGAKKYVLINDKGNNVIW